MRHCKALAMARLRFLGALMGAAFLVLVPRESLASQPLEIEDAVEVSLGFSHTCALTGEGNVRCWGWNGGGPLGDGSTTDRVTPASVVHLDGRVFDIAAGWFHTCALTEAGAVKCWGSNAQGQLAVETGAPCRLPPPDDDVAMPCSLVPVSVPGLASDMRAVSAGASHTCAVTSGGSVKCWGSNSSGELGDGTTEGRGEPVDVRGLDHGAVAVSAGFGYTCAITDGGSVKCWGGNLMGTLGNGTTTDNATPADVCADASCSEPLSQVVQVASGFGHTCALTAAGAVKCWGSNVRGELGAPTTEQCFFEFPCSTVPVQVQNLESGVVAIATGFMHSCALTELGAVKCWGGSYGSGDWSYSPADVPGLASGVAAIGEGPSHGCAVMREGDIRCWGDNNWGQLGDGTTIGSSLPQEVWTLSGRGDPNCDRGITSIDAFLVLQVDAGYIQQLPCPDGADASGDSTINSLDAALILQFHAGLMN